MADFKSKCEQMAMDQPPVVVRVKRLIGQSHKLILPSNYWLTDGASLSIDHNDSDHPGEYYQIPSVVSRTDLPRHENAS